MSSVTVGLRRQLLCRQSQWGWVVSYCVVSHSGDGASVTVGLGRQSLWGWVVSYCVVCHCGDGSSVTVGLGRQLLCHREHRIIVSSVTVGLGRQLLSSVILSP